jgi:hypothetical protein
MIRPTTPTVICGGCWITGYDTILAKNFGARECKENTRRTQGEHKEKTGKIV